MILIALAIGIGFWGPKSEPVASPLEIRFYSDYLVVFREKRYYSRKVTRKEYNKFFYSDISKIEYDYRIRRLDFILKILYNLTSNDYYKTIMSIDDIGYSDKIISVGIQLLQ